MYIRTGHYGLNKHRKRTGTVDTAQYKCGADEQTPHHNDILQTCPLFEKARQLTWGGRHPDKQEAVRQLNEELEIEVARFARWGRCSHLGPTKEISPRHYCCYNQGSPLYISP